MKYSISVLASTVLLCLVSGGSVYAQKVEDSKRENWITLADTKGRFVVQAPSTWTGSHFDRKDKSGIDFVAPEKGPLANAKFQVYAYNDPGITSQLTVRYWIGMFTQQIEKGGLRSYRSPEDITIGNQKALVLFYRHRLKKKVEEEDREFEVSYWFLPVKIDAKRFVVMNLGVEKRFLDGHEEMAMKLFSSVRFGQNVPPKKTSVDEKDE